MRPLCKLASTHGRVGWNATPFTRGDFASNLVSIVDFQLHKSQRHQEAVHKKKALRELKLASKELVNGTATAHKAETQKRNSDR
eukprot:m.31507 g.31507  ORF g.31507 m.31507 type:complete len:84 (+) comp9423_c0_seq1:4769-5020(+)